MNYDLQKRWVEESCGNKEVNFQEWIRLTQKNHVLFVHNDVPNLHQENQHVQPWLRTMAYAFGLLYPNTEIHIHEMDAVGTSKTKPPISNPSLDHGFYGFPRCDELVLLQYAKEYLCNEWCYLDIHSTQMQISYEGTTSNQGVALGMNAGTSMTLMKFEVGKIHSKQVWIDLMTGKEVEITEQGNFQMIVPARGVVVVVPKEHEHIKLNQLIQPSLYTHVLIPEKDAPKQIRVKPLGYSMEFDAKPTCITNGFVQFTFPIGYSLGSTITVHDRSYLIHAGSFEIINQELRFASVSPQKVVMLFYIGPIVDPVLHYRKAAETSWQDVCSIGFNGRYAYVALPIEQQAGIEFVWRSKWGQWDHPGINLRANYGVHKYNTQTWGRWSYVEKYNQCVEDALDVSECFE